MGFEEIFESGFIKAFIAEYYEYKMHSYYPDKDRLLYILCNSEAEKIEVTNKQIEYTKSEIKNLGWEALSSAYLLSCKAESGPNYIEPDKRFDFWLNHFVEEFKDNTDSFCPILTALLHLSEDTESDESSSNTRLVESQTESDENFWEIFPKSLRPKNKDLSIEYLVALETEIEDIIQYDINQFTENGLWDFDFVEYENFIESNKIIQNLVEISELFVQLNRLDMFKEFLMPFTQVETKKQNVELAEFLKDKSKINLILAVQNEFRHFEGKRLAILIHLLQVENKIISIISNSKTHSRKQFIQLFKEDSSFYKFEAVNKYIDPFSNELNLPTKKEIDANYIIIKEKLTKIIENPVV